MFGLLKKITFTKTRIEITSDLLKNKKIYSFLDFYEQPDIKKHLDKIIAKTNEEYFFVGNLRCNSKTIEKIKKYIKHNLCKTKNKYSRMFKQERLDIICAMDFLNYSPTTDETVPDDFLIALKPNHKDYSKHAVKED